MTESVGNGHIEGELFMVIFLVGVYLFCFFCPSEVEEANSPFKLNIIVDVSLFMSLNDS